MNTGWLRKIGLLQRDLGAADGSGGIAGSGWTTAANGRRRVSVKPISSQTPFAEGQRQERVTHEVRTHYFKLTETSAIPTVGMRWVIDGMAYIINSIIDPKLIHRDLIFRCEERLAQ